MRYFPDASRMCFFLRFLLDLSGDDESRLDDLVTELCTIVQSSVMHVFQCLEKEGVFSAPDSMPAAPPFRSLRQFQ